MNKNIPSWINPLWYQFEKGFAKSFTYMIKLFLFRFLFNNNNKNVEFSACLLDLL